MIVTYLRSSSYNAWDFCNHSYFMDYVLGFEQDPRPRTIMGSIAHRVLEGLGREQLAVQNKQEFVDDDLFGNFKPGSLSVNQMLNIAFDFFTTKSNNNFTEKDYRFCESTINKILDYGNGCCNPKNKNLLAIEKRFDITFQQTWAKYKFKIPNSDKFTEGQLSLKGTVDQISIIDSNTIEVLDFKTGQQKDWKTGQVKDYKYLCDDKQLRLYHYALSKTYPEYKNIILSILFVNYGGLYSIVFDDNDLIITEKMIRKRFDEIRTTNLPHQRKGYHCKAFCFYGRNNLLNDNLCICDRVRQDLYDIGIEKTTEKYVKDNKFMNYKPPGT